MKPVSILRNVFIAATLAAPCHPVSAQTEVMAWSNLTGIRIDGQLIEFETSFRVVEKEWEWASATGRERQQTTFDRDGAMTKVTGSTNRIFFEQSVEDLSKGAAAITLSCRSDTTRRAEGVFWCVELPASSYGGGTVKVGSRSISIPSLVDGQRDPVRASGKQVVIEAPGRAIKLVLTSSVNVFVRKERGNAAIYLQLAGGDLKKGKKGRFGIDLTASGETDNRPVTVVVDSDRPGQRFDGFGGNFRLQNMANDPKVIDWCLENMRVAWGRVEMPWASWEPGESDNSLADARAGKIGERVGMSMRMAHRLAAIGMPVVVSAWFPPAWALADGQKPRRGGVAGLRLDPEKTERIYRSLADYLVCLKELYGVEAHSFSFNESDIGIDVLHTAREHADFIKGFGAHLASRGLSTRLLLGDNSDATTYDFILPAIDDPETHKYIAAVSFHSWRGCDDETLAKWSAAARKLNVPLIVGEGSTDAAAWRYPQILLEPTFALYEINLYIRICAISRPISILQWQLTSDYSLLAGEGILGMDGPLRPTQRFWNLKQLSETPEEAFALPFTCDREDVNCAAFGNIARGEYAVHIVNNGAARAAVIKGIPARDSGVRVFATNNVLSRQEIGATRAANGDITVEMPAASFITVKMQ